MNAQSRVLRASGNVDGRGGGGGSLSTWELELKLGDRCYATPLAHRD